MIIIRSLYFLAFAFFACCPTYCLAYLDPSQGSLLWQIVFPVVAFAIGTLGIAIKWLANNFRRVLRFIRRLLGMQS